MSLTDCTREVLSLALRLHEMFTGNPGYEGLTATEQVHFCICEAKAEIDDME